MDDTTKSDPKFWEWLRNRNRQPEQVKRVYLELPKLPVYRQEDESVDRGVCIIEVM